MLRMAPEGEVTGQCLCFCSRYHRHSKNTCWRSGKGHIDQTPLRSVRYLSGLSLCWRAQCSLGALGLCAVPSPAAPAQGSSSAGSWHGDSMWAVLLFLLLASAWATFSPRGASLQRLMVLLQSEVTFCMAPAGCSQYMCGHHHRSAQCGCTQRFHRTETMRDDGTFCLSVFVVEACPVRLFCS